MRIFTFHFNPKADDNIIFDDFCYEPENAYDKRLGGVYMLGFLKNIIPQNKNFLNNLAKKIKENFYSAGISDSGKALKYSLKKGNEYLEKIAKDGDVSWLGNLNCAILTIKNKDLNFTKVGKIKVYLLRKGQIIDIDQRLKFEEIDPYPLKVFGKIISGKLTEEDTLLVLNEEIANFFVSQKLLYEIANVLPFDDKQLKEIFEKKRDKLLKMRGICLLMHLTPNAASKKREDIFAKVEREKFSFKKILNPLLKYFQKTKQKLLKNREKEKKKKSPVKDTADSKRKKSAQKKQKKILPNIGLPAPLKTLFLNLLKIKIPKIGVAELKTLKKNKKAILVIFLIVFLLLGFFIFGRQKQIEKERYQQKLEEIQEKITEAENYLMIADINSQAKELANNLFKKALTDANTLPEFNEQIVKLKASVRQNLYTLNNLETIEDIQPIFSFTAKEFVPQKMVIRDENIYFFNPYADNILELKNESETAIIQTEAKFNKASLGEKSILFFQKPNKIFELKNNQLSPFLDLETLDFQLDDFYIYRNNLYFLEKNSGETIKYVKNDSPQLWLNDTAKKAVNAKSLAVDGFVWILEKDNTINQYYIGQLRDTFELDIFPQVADLSKIYTSWDVPYLYILEPIQKRIIILNKQGKLIRQYQGEKFNNLLDFGVSKDGKTIYLLNGLELFEIEIK